MLPSILGHGSGKVFGWLGSSVLGSFFGAPVSESKPHQRLDILEHFMKSSMTPFGPLSGVPFCERCLELRIGSYIGRACADLHWSVSVRISLH